MSRARSVLVGLIIALATLLTWEAAALIRHHQDPNQTPTTATAPVVP